jgi:hypothetical protein
LAAWTDAPERLALALLIATLGAIYLIGAATTWRTAPALAAAQAAIGSAQLAWVVALQLSVGTPSGDASASHRPQRLLQVGALAQLALLALWAASRTVGLGTSPLPVTALDLICAIDALAIAALAIHRARPAHGPTAIWRCQLAAVLAGMTLFTLGAAHAHASSPSGGFFGGAPGGHFLCRPL